MTSGRRWTDDPVVLGISGLLVFTLVWEAAARIGWLNPVVVSSPSRIAAAFADQVASGQYVGDLGVSLAELAVGFVLSVIVGVAVGIAMGLNRDVEYALDPFVWFLYSTPLIALYPLLVVWLGFGFVTVVTVAFLLTVVSIVVNTLAGVRSVDPVLIRAVRAFGGDRGAVIRKVIVPASLPMIMAGIRIGLSRTLIGVVLGEMFSANAGLGFRMTVYAARLRTADVFVPLITFVVIGVVITQLVGLVERRLQAWKGSPLSS